MNMFKTDALFEEAARSAESCDKLIKRLRGYRVRCVIGMVGIAVIAAGFLVWNLVLARRSLNEELKPEPPTPAPILENLGSQGYRLTYPRVPIPHIAFEIPESVTAILMAFFMVMLICMVVALLHHDACIKMLLLMRAQKALGPPPRS